jgi:hypothetical protein
MLEDRVSGIKKKIKMVVKPEIPAISHKDAVQVFHRVLHSVVSTCRQCKIDWELTLPKFPRSIVAKVSQYIS